MWIISVTSLVIVILLCLVGAFSAKFNDNLLQRLGLGLVAIAMWPRLESLVEFSGYAKHMPDWTLLGQHLGLACYALGTAWKVWRYRATPPTEPTAPGDFDELEQQNGMDQSSR